MWHASWSRHQYFHNYHRLIRPYLIWILKHSNIFSCPLPPGKTMKKLLMKSFFRLIFSYVYAFVGGCIFYVIERKPETNKEVYSRLSRKLHRDFTNQFNSSINESDFKCFMQKAFEVVSVGNKMDWSILSGLSFTMTSLTTIGKWFK